MPLLSPFELRKAEDACDAKLLGDIAAYGWHVVQIQQETDSPQFAFTVGLYYQFLQPEVLNLAMTLIYSNCSAYSQAAANQTVQRTGGSRFAQSEVRTSAAAAPHR